LRLISAAVGYIVNIFIRCCHYFFLQAPSFGKSQRTLTGNELASYIVHYTSSNYTFPNSISAVAHTGTS